MTVATDSIEKTLGFNQPKKRSMKKTFLLLLIFIALAGGAFWIWKDFSGNENTEYKTVTAEIKDLTTTVSATGNLEPTNTVDVGIEVSGTISEVLVDYNDRVKKGQTMARLDTTKLMSKVTSYQSALSKFQANIDEAKAQLKNAEHESDRVHQMFAATNGNYPSKKEVDEASIAVEKAKAQLSAAIAQSNQSGAELRTVQEDLRKAVVISPVEGIVLERKVEPGQTVVASMQIPVLFRMAEDLTKMKVLVSVDEADVGGVKENQKVEFSVDAYPNRKFEGKITQLRMNSAVVNGVVTYGAVVEVHNDDLLLRPGMTANASIITDTHKNVTVIPNAALRFSPPSSENGNDKKKKRANNENDKGDHIWILKNKIPTKTKVQIGESDGIMSILLDSPLKPGDLIITGVEEQP